MSLGLLIRASSGWRRVLGIAAKAVVWVAPCPKRFTLKDPPCIESSFLRFGTGPGSGRSKRTIFKGRACTESSFLDFGTGPAGLWGGPKRVLYSPNRNCWGSQFILQRVDGQDELGT